MTTSTTQPESGTATWTIDPAHTLVEFSARHMMITTVKGRFAGVTGTIEANGEDPRASAVRVELDAASLDTRTAQRDEHLRSADFLDVENHPAITFRSTRIEGGFREPGDTFRVVGDLAIRGTTREIVLEATYEGSGRDPWGGERASFSAEGRIDRRDFGLTWNAALETGGVLVGNEVRISVDAQAVRGE